MPRDDYLSRIDRSLESIDAHIERGNELFARNTEAFEANREASERNREAFERTIGALDRIDRRLDQAEGRESQDRRFFDELLERNARMTENLIEAMQTGFASLQAEIHDQREQIQANTQALLRVLDRLPGGPQAT